MKWFSTLAPLLVFLPTLLLSQTTTGALEGWLFDTSGGAIIGASVTITSPDLQGQRSVSTDDRGFFRFPTLPVGTYTASISHLSFKPIRIDNAVVSLGKTTSLGDIRLAERAVEIAEVIVTARQSGIDPLSVTVGATLDVDRLKNLPIDRSYQSVPQFVAHANPSYYGDGVNFAGGTGLENKYYLNGVDVSDPFRGLGGTNLPYNFVREIQIKIGAYEAEFRGSLGGTLNVVTYSGGNQTSGQAFGFFTNNSFAGSPRYAIGQATKGGYTQYDAGVSLGGALMKDRLWYFLAYNQKHVSEDVPIPGLSYHEDLTTTHMFASKMTWNADENNLFVFTAIGDPSSRRGVGFRLNGQMAPRSELLNPDPWLADIKTGGIGLSLMGTHLVTERFSLESALSLVAHTDEYKAATSAGDAFAFIDDATNTLSGGYSDPSYESTRQLTASLKASMIIGGHTLKAGLEVLEISMESNTRVKTLEKVDDSSYVKYDYSIIGKIKHQLPSVFLQDSWQVIPRLCVNAGVRWDPQYMYDSDSRIAQKITDQIQPRLGIVYQPGEVGLNKVMASYGRFYQPVQMSLSELYHNRNVVWAYTQYTHDPRIDPSGGKPGFSSSIFLTNVPDLKGQGYDEFTIGCERLIAHDMKIGIRGIYRTLLQGIEDGIDLSTGQSVYGNPGSGIMKAWDPAKRDYSAFEVTLERTSVDGLNLIATYVLSRNYGNYTGLAQTDNRFLTFPNNTNQYDVPELLQNAMGLLPNDRTHAFKLLSWYLFDFGMSVGGSLMWLSGTPLSEFGGSSFGSPLYDFIKPRGTSGRTPSLWDLNLRLVYDLPVRVTNSGSTRLILDMFHIGSERTAVQFDQVHFFAQDESGNQSDRNPVYGQAIQFAPPMSVRVGMEVNF